MENVPIQDNLAEIDSMVKQIVKEFHLYGITIKVIRCTKFGLVSSLDIV